MAQHIYMYLVDVYVTRCILRLWLTDLFVVDPHLPLPTLQLSEIKKKKKKKPLKAV